MGSYKIKNLILNGILMMLTVLGLLLIQKNGLNMYIYQINRKKNTFL